MKKCIILGAFLFILVLICHSSSADPVEPTLEDGDFYVFTYSDPVSSSWFNYSGTFSVSDETNPNNAWASYKADTFLNGNGSLKLSGNSTDNYGRFIFDNMSSSAPFNIDYGLYLDMVDYWGTSYPFGRMSASFGNSTDTAFTLYYEYYYNSYSYNPAYDLNNDDHVNMWDMQEILDNYGASGDPGWISADINIDGNIDAMDISMFTSNFETTDYVKITCDSDVLGYYPVKGMDNFQASMTPNLFYTSVQFEKIDDDTSKAYFSFLDQEDTWYYPGNYTGTVVTFDMTDLDRVNFTVYENYDHDDTGETNIWLDYIRLHETPWNINPDLTPAHLSTVQPYTNISIGVDEYNISTLSIISLPMYGDSYLYWYDDFTGSYSCSDSSYDKLLDSFIISDYYSFCSDTVHNFYINTTVTGGDGTRYIWHHPNSTILLDDEYVSRFSVDSVTFPEIDSFSPAHSSSDHPRHVYLNATVNSSEDYSFDSTLALQVYDTDDNHWYARELINDEYEMDYVYGESMNISCYYDIETTETTVYWRILFETSDNDTYIYPDTGGTHIGSGDAYSRCWSLTSGNVSAPAVNISPVNGSTINPYDSDGVYINISHDSDLGWGGYSYGITLSQESPWHSYSYPTRSANGNISFYFSPSDFFDSGGWNHPDNDSELYIIVNTVDINGVNTSFFVYNCSYPDSEYEPSIDIDTPEDNETYHNTEWGQDDTHTLRFTVSSPTGEKMFLYYEVYSYIVEHSSTFLDEAVVYPVDEESSILDENEWGIGYRRISWNNYLNNGELCSNGTYTADLSYDIPWSDQRYVLRVYAEYESGTTVYNSTMFDVGDVDNPMNPDEPLKFSVRDLEFNPDRPHEGVTFKVCTNLRSSLKPVLGIIISNKDESNFHYYGQVSTRQGYTSIEDTPYHEYIIYPSGMKLNDEYIFNIGMMYWKSKGYPNRDIEYFKDYGHEIELSSLYKEQGALTYQKEWWSVRSIKTETEGDWNIIDFLWPWASDDPGTIILSDKYYVRYHEYEHLRRLGFIGTASSLTDTDDETIGTFGDIPDMSQVIHDEAHNLGIGFIDGIATIVIILGFIVLGFMLVKGLAVNLPLPIIGGFAIMGAVFAGVLGFAPLWWYIVPFVLLLLIYIIKAGNWVLSNFMWNNDMHEGGGKK